MEQLFEKITNFAGFTNTPHIMPLEFMDHHLIKQAAGELHPDIDKYIRMAKPIPGKSILLIDAMGAGETWGSNVNGDYFEEEQLMNEGDDYGYRTFMLYAYPYKHHQNEAMKSDPSRRYGDRVVLSVYHKPMKRVQLVVIINNDRCSDVLNSIDAGSYPDVSMACGVKYDRCSLCGSIHKTRDDYCYHAKYELNKVLGDGRKVYLINHRPRFHDISFVVIGAEKAAKTLLKIASPFNLNTITLPDPGQKKAVIHKEITITQPDMTLIPGPELETRQNIADILGFNEPMMDPGVLESLSAFPMQDVWETLGRAGILLEPIEFQHMMASKILSPDDARMLTSAGAVFDDECVEDIPELPEGKPSSSIMMVISKEMPKKSAHMPWIAMRPMTKQASALSSSVKSVLKWPVMAGLYAAYKGVVPDSVRTMIKEGYDAMSPYVPSMINNAAMATGVMLGHEIGNTLGATPPQGDYWAPMYDQGYEMGKSSGALDILKSPAAYGIASLPAFYAVSKMKRMKMDSAPDLYNGDVTSTDMLLGAKPWLTTALGALGTYKGAQGIKNLFVKKAEVAIQDPVWEHVKKKMHFFY